MLEYLFFSQETEINDTGIYFKLTNTGQTIAQINPEVINKILSVIKLGNFNGFVDTLVSSVETQKEALICEMSK